MEGQGLGFMIWERSRPSGNSERAATPKHMKTPREARVFTIHRTMAPRTRVVKRRESALSDEHAEQVSWFHRDHELAMQLIVLLKEKRRGKIRDMSRLMALNNPGHYQAAINIIYEQISDINFELSIAEHEHEQAMSYYEEWMYTGE